MKIETVPAEHYNNSIKQVTRLASENQRLKIALKEIAALKDSEEFGNVVPGAWRELAELALAK